jgi:hypothetical protein
MAALAVLTGCSSGPTEAEPSDGAVVEYFEALSGDRSLAPAAARSGSAAELYAWYFQNIGEALATTENGADPVTMEVVDQAVELTTSGQTAVYDNLMINDDKMESFDIDGTLIDERVTTSAPVDAGSVTLTRIASYRTTGGIVITTFLAENDGSTTATLDTDAATFVDSSGESFTAGFVIGPNEVTPGGTTSLALIWSGDDPVGTMTLPIGAAAGQAADGVEIIAELVPLD